MEIDLVLWQEAHQCFRCRPPEINVVAWIIGLGLWSVLALATMLICYR